MTVLLIVVAVLILIGLIRFGVGLRYDDKGFTVKIYTFLFKFTVYPKKKKEKNKENKKVKHESEKPAEQKEKKGGGTLTFLRNSAKPILDMLGRLPKKLRVDMLEVHYIAAGAVPCQAAICYGRASAAAGAILPMLDNYFKIKKYNVTTDVDFSGAQDTVIADIRISLALWECVAFILFPAIKILIKSADKRKVDNNGKTTDK